jgi:hypothetical protein
MKSKLFQLALPIFMGIILLTISIVVGCKDSVTESSKKHCTDTAYPLYCASQGVCCPRGHAYYCDGGCYESGCPGGTVTMGDCRPE